jgi:hypothetical protein
MKLEACLVCLAFLASAVMAQQAPISKWMTQQTPINGNDGVALTDQQMAAYSARALLGSGAAANSLGMHFSAARGNRQLAEYWYHISAENGDAGGEFAYGSMLFEDSSENEARAIFWLEKSSRQGDGNARRQLTHMMHCPNLVANDPCS